MKRLGHPREPLSPDGFATYMADIVATNPDVADAKEAGLKLMAALLAELGYAEGVLIYGQMSEWYEGQ